MIGGYLVLISHGIGIGTQYYNKSYLQIKNFHVKIEMNLHG